MASYVKFHDFVEQLGKGVHQLHSAGHELKVFLTNSTPNVSTHTLKADLTEITEQYGYTAGGDDTENDYTESGGTGTLTGTDCIWNASGGSFGPFRYCVLYNNTPSSPLDPLISYWDYGSALTVNNGESFTVDFGASIFTLS